MIAKDGRSLDGTGGMHVSVLFQEGDDRDFQTPHANLVSTTSPPRLHHPRCIFDPLMLTPCITVYPRHGDRIG